MKNVYLINLQMELMKQYEADVEVWARGELQTFLNENEGTLKDLKSIDPIAYFGSGFEFFKSPIKMTSEVLGLTQKLSVFNTEEVFFQLLGKNDLVDALIWLFQDNEDLDKKTATATLHYLFLTVCENTFKKFMVIREIAQAIK